MLWDHVCGNAGQWYHFWPTGMGVTINCARGTTGECASDSYCDIPPTNALVTIEQHSVKAPPSCSTAWLTPTI